MALDSGTVRNQMAILNRLFVDKGAAFSAAGARSILKIDFPSPDHERMHELAAKARAGILTAEEQGELDAYEVVGHMLGLMHSRARLALKRRATSA